MNESTGDDKTSPDSHLTSARLGPYAIACSLLIGCMSPTDADTEMRGQELNRVSEKPSEVHEVRASVRRSGDIVEVEVLADQPFRFGAMPAVLVVGDRTFSRSRHPPDGRLDTLIFMIDAAEFDALEDGAEASVGYLDSGAELDEPPPNARGAARMPNIRPDQVDQKRDLGKFRKNRLEIAK